jgi:hypothetical protein
MLPVQYSSEGICFVISEEQYYLEEIYVSCPTMMITFVNAPLLLNMHLW